MKNFVILLIIFCPMFLFSQTINIYLNDGTLREVDITMIDNITFSIGGGSLACPDTPTVTYEGKTYNTVQIGNQCWLRENLDVGTMIQENTNQTDNGIIEKYCIDNIQEMCDSYGGLYQWNEAMQYSFQRQGICPDGWHIPSSLEQTILILQVNNSGNALKAIGEGSGNGAGTNTSGFSALIPGTQASFWSGERAFNNSLAFSIRLFNTSDEIYNPIVDMDLGLSIRCLKD